MTAENRLRRLALALLFPPRCPLCDAVLGFRQTCGACAAVEPPLRRPDGEPVAKEGHLLTFVEAAYAPYWYEGPVRRAVWRVKYDEREDTARAMAARMADQLRAAGYAPALILPVPSSKGELRRRGYAPPALLARLLGQALDVPVREDVLQKPFETRHQRGLGPQERRANLIGAFQVTPRQAVRDKQVLLVDDVLTTGATLDECAKMLLAAGAAQVRAVCIAVTRQEEGAGT